MGIIEYVAIVCLGLFVFRFICLFLGNLYVDSNPFAFDRSDAFIIGLLVIVKLLFLFLVLYGIISLIGWFFITL